MKDDPRSVWAVPMAALLVASCANGSGGAADDVPTTSTSVAASHVGTGGLVLSTQESDTTYYFRGETVYAEGGYSWYFVYQNGAKIYLGDTSNEEPIRDLALPKTQLANGEYWFEVEATAYDPLHNRWFSYVVSSDGVTLPLLHAAPDVGVIPDGATCPSLAQTVHIFMDNEDSRAASSVMGWVGGTVLDGNRNTSFIFCRVNGNSFASLSTTSSNSTNYAVLRLGANCPPGSVKFSRTFDNENNQNTNSWSGNIAPNTTITDTTLNFCLFRGGSTTAPLPNLGFVYGVFASSAFTSAVQHGYVFTDDEDNGANGYNVDLSASNDAYQIIEPGGNTYLHMARVPRCNDGVCSNGETHSTCPADCDQCYDGICGPHENAITCEADCTFCGDGICSTGEICMADCFDPCSSPDPSQPVACAGGPVEEPKE